MTYTEELEFKMSMAQGQCEELKKKMKKPENQCLYFSYSKELATLEGEHRGLYLALELFKSFKRREGSKREKL